MSFLCIVVLQYHSFYLTLYQQLQSNDIFFSYLLCIFTCLSFPDNVILLSSVNTMIFLFTTVL